MNQLEVQIMGQSYLLGCPAGGEAPMREAVQKVDAAMCKIRDAGKVRARDRIAVLAALNLAFELVERSGSAPEPYASAKTPEHTPGLANTPSSSAVTANEEAALRALMQRLDSAITEDGQLL